MNEIRFYHETDEYGYLSNYWVATIHIEGKSWKSTEHYYQGQKTLDQTYAQRIRQAPTCDEAKDLGNDPACVYRPDWETEKIEAMRVAIRAKFDQHDDLRALLLGTGDAILIEDSRSDYYWGIGEAGTGKNMLGILLMELRQTYVNNETT
ncbi:MAG: NADAR family protein [Sphaerochaeta sp.]|nr:NADAR family protein [Sphaerochaeta sp.]